MRSIRKRKKYYRKFSPEIVRQFILRAAKKNRVTGWHHKRQERTLGIAPLLNEDDVITVKIEWDKSPNLTTEIECLTVHTVAL